MELLCQISLKIDSFGNWVKGSGKVNGIPLAKTGGIVKEIKKTILLFIINTSINAEISNTSINLSTIAILNTKTPNK